MLGFDKIDSHFEFSSFTAFLLTDVVTRLKIRTQIMLVTNLK